MEPYIITKTDDLVDFCQSLESCEFIAVDTEFMRRSTYFSQLCLIQVAGDRGQEALIDTLSDGIDLFCLCDLFKNPKIVKVFHAARQDLEVFFHLFHFIPQPLYDTQVAAMFLGYGHQVGYENLVQQLLSVELNKKVRITDWTERPLSQAQKEYALCDVTHLRDIYISFQKQLKKLNRQQWVEEEMNHLNDVELYQPPIEKAWKRIKFHSKSPRYVTALKELAAWREKRAVEMNIPRNHFLKDQAILDVCGHFPEDIEQIQNRKSFKNSSLSHDDMNEILNCVKRVSSYGQDQLFRPDVYQSPSKQKSLQIEALKVILKFYSFKHQISSQIIASTRDLEKIIDQDQPEVPALKGWRWDVFGQHAMAFKEGKTHFFIENNQLKIS